VVIYMFFHATTTTAVILMIWCILISFLDNILKPLLLGRGASSPMLVIFLGAIGGFLLSGIIGLFVGAVVLALGYDLFMIWLKNPENTDAIPSQLPEEKE
jgi:predicted PurR-regulated permease PerM